MAFKLRGSPMARNFGIGSPNKLSAFKHPHENGSGDDHPASFNHKSSEENSLAEDEAFNPNKAGKTKKGRKRGAHGSSRKDQKGEFFDVTTRNASDRGAGSINDVNLLPEAEVAAPTRKEERQAKRDDRKDSRKDKRDERKEARNKRRSDRKANS